MSKSNVKEKLISAYCILCTRLFNPHNYGISVLGMPMLKWEKLIVRQVNYLTPDHMARLLSRSFV